MKLKCPECGGTLNLQTPKPGSYRPKCTHCGKSFRLKMTGDTPPKVGVGKLVAKAKVAKSVAEPAVKFSSIAPSSSVDSDAIEATVDQGTAQTKGGVDATMDGAANPSEQTADGSLVVNQSAASPSVSVFRGRKSQRGSIKVSTTSRSDSSGSQRLSGEMIDSSEGDIPERLGGYRIMRLLGRGAMGAVYEAKQVSLDRMVALKTVRGRLASNPAALARFTREAYAAAQLTHHNVVQIYDFGEDAGRHFFSMEWVRGGPLDELVKQKGSLDPKLAAGYVLQAARGLAMAHQNGMVHRDVKPANLLLNDEGVVKVADLGLVKIPDLPDPDTSVGAMASGSGQSGTDVTMQGTAVGTPAYMAPEQGVDAAAVDHRADIYSLGCTLFFLLAGRVPFGGSVVSEVLQQHASETLPSLTALNARIPASLDAIVKHSMAKRPDQRYASLDEMCDDLEDYLGVSDDGNFSPTSSQADQLESIAKAYGSATKLESLTGTVVLALVGISVLMTVASFAVGWQWVLLGPMVGITAVVTALALGGSQSQVSMHLRRWIGSLHLLDYVTAALGVIAFAVVTLVSACWLGAILGAILGASIGAGYHFGFADSIRKSSEGSAEQARKFVRDLRISGADETGIRSFVARYSGKPWQRLFERLFGYEALVAMRKQLAGDAAFSGNVASLSLRDRVCTALAKRVAAKKRASDHQRLAKIEQQGLKSEGLNDADAKERAWQMAAAVMEASQISEPVRGEGKSQAEAKREKMKAMLADARSGNYKMKRDKLASVRFLLGGQTRLLVGSLLLTVFALWGNSNGLFDSLKDIETLKQISSGDVDLLVLRDAAMNANFESSDGKVLGGASPWSVGIAGFLLVLSSFVSGWRMTPFAVIATVAILFGPLLGVPAFGESLQPWMVSGLVGLAIYIPGVLWGEAKS